MADFDGVTIEVNQSIDGLTDWAGGADDGVDVNATVANYCDLVTRTLLATFPGADVRIYLRGEGRTNIGGTCEAALLLTPECVDGIVGNIFSDGNPAPIVAYT